MTSTLTELNRLMATLEEVSKKTRIRIGLVQQGRSQTELGGKS